MCPIVDTSPGAEGQWFPVLCFIIACLGLISLICQRIKGYTSICHQFLLNTTCLCVIIGQIPAADRGISFLFLDSQFTMCNVFKMSRNPCSNQGATSDEATFLILCVLSVLDLYISVFLAFRHLYLLQPTVRSLTYE